MRWYFSVDAVLISEMSSAITGKVTPWDQENEPEEQSRQLWP